MLEINEIQANGKEAGVHGLLPRGGSSVFCKCTVHLMLGQLFNPQTTWVGGYKCNRILTPLAALPVILGLDKEEVICVFELGN